MREKEERERMKPTLKELADSYFWDRNRTHRSSIDFISSLKFNTYWQKFDEYLGIFWSRVQHLYLVGNTSNLPIYTELRNKFVPGIYWSGDYKWILIYGATRDQLNWIYPRLEKNVRTMGVVDMPLSCLDVSKLKGLKELRIKSSIHSDKARMLIKGLPQLTELEYLDLSGCPLGNKLDISILPKLKTMKVAGVEKLDWLIGPSRNSSLESLEIVNISQQKHISLGELSSLKYLNLSNNPALEAVSGLGTFSNLCHLDLSNTALSVIPEDLQHHHLESLKLCNLNLTELPNWLPNLHIPIHRKIEPGISLMGTEVQDIDMSIFDQSDAMIQTWFEDRIAGRVVPLNEIKVVFLGDGESGKSHTIARLLNDGGDPLDYTDQATPGIVIKNKMYEHAGRQFQVHYWDFGGQEILHSMHRMFLTERTVYVVLVNARDETQDIRATYWLNNVQNFAKDAPVIVVLNKIDQNPNASLNIKDLKRKFKGLRSVVRMSALTSTKEEFNNTLTKALLDEIHLTGHLGVRWPAPWVAVKNKLEDMKTNYIHGNEYQEICKECGVNESQKDLLNWFNDLGVSFCYSDDYRLEDYVILRPDWITNAIYIILFNPCEGARNGMLPHKSIQKLLKPHPKDFDKIRRVLPEVTYEWEETQYVLNVIRKFQLSFVGQEGTEFIPMLCQRDSMEVAREYENQLDTLEFRMEFNYLPNNVLHRLMVERQNELDLRNVWRTGALFIQEGTKTSAVVTIDGNNLKILVRSVEKMHRPNTYLCMLKANIDRIWEHMNLNPPKNVLVYKFSDQKIEFDYHRLLLMHERGKETEFCVELNDDINIHDILNQAAPLIDDNTHRLLCGIVAACQDMQQKALYWNTDEDERNDYLRDVLRHRGYIVHDQTRIGLGAGGKKAGEVDLEIRRINSIPWTICEALRINDGSKIDWLRHLEKLLINYNQLGAKHLFLLTYVDCSQSKFETLWKEYQHYIPTISNDRFSCIVNRFEDIHLEQWDHHSSVRVCKCYYSCGEYTPAVYHVFARMGR